MTPKEFKKEIDALRNEIGPRAQVWVTISSDAMFSVNDRVLSGSIYPRGMHDSSAIIRIEADDFATLFAQLREKWGEWGADHRKQTVRKMALAIIRITAEQGHCTDAALRVEFDANEVKLLSADAITDANEIAGNGPFSIIPMIGANATEAA